jgi:hypothetical protein
MAYSTVIVITPDNMKYQAEVDLEADDDAILLGLVSKTKLPVRDEKGRDIRYRLNIIGATRLRPGGTVKIEKEEPPAVGDVTPIP